MINERGNAVCDSCGVEYEYFSSPMLNDEIWKSISNEYIDENGKWHGQMFCRKKIPYERQVLDILKKYPGAMQELIELANIDANRYPFLGIVKQ